MKHKLSTKWLWVKETGYSRIMNSELRPTNFTCSSHLFHLSTSFFWIKLLHSIPFKTCSEGGKRCICLNILQSKLSTEEKRQDWEPLLRQQLPFPILRCNCIPRVTTSKHVIRNATQGARRNGLLVGYKKGPGSIITFYLYPRGKTHYSTALGPWCSWSEQGHALQHCFISQLW